MPALARRMSTQHALALPSPAASNTVVIDVRCSLRIEADQRVIVVAVLPVHHYRAEDAVAEAYAMVFWWSRASPLQFGHFQRFITARIVDILGRGGLNH
jgi:hypothetical protein